MKLDPTERSLRTGGALPLGDCCHGNRGVARIRTRTSIQPPPPKRVIKEESGVRPRQRLKRTSKTEKVQTPSGLMADAQTGNQPGEVLHGPNLHQTRIRIVCDSVSGVFFKGIKL